MLTLEAVKSVYGLVCFTLCLIIASPTVAVLVVLPGGEQFSEMWLLGEQRMAEGYPFNVKADETYSVYLGVGNRMGGLEQYRVYVKVRNPTEPVPDASDGTPSGLGPVFEYGFFLRNREVWESEILFSFEDVSFEGSSSNVYSLALDGHVVKIAKSVSWDDESHGFYCQLFFELWRYNMALSEFQYHNRFVGIWLNMTA